MKNNKMTKELIEIFFKNHNETSMQKYFCYQNINEIKALLTKILYSKVTSVMT